MATTALPLSPRKPYAVTGGLSMRMTIILVFLTHGFVNTLLLTPWNPLRSYFWNAASLTESEAWMLDWFTEGHFHFYVLLASLFLSIQGQNEARLEERLVYLCATLVTCSLSTGMFSLDVLNQPMAGLMGAIYLGLLAAIMYQTSAVPSQSSTAELLFPSRGDRSETIPMATVAVGIVAVLNGVRGIELAFGEGLELDSAENSLVYQRLFQVFACQAVWVTFILIWTAAQATVEQQKAVLMGQFLVHFTSIVLSAGSPGALMPASEARAAGINNFLGLCITLLGAN
jgi:hypothetical protein